MWWGGEGGGANIKCEGWGGGRVANMKSEVWGRRGGEANMKCEGRGGGRKHEMPRVLL